MRSPLFRVAANDSPSTSRDRTSSAAIRRSTSLKATSRVAGRSARRPQKRITQQTANPPVRTSAARRREEGIGTGTPATDRIAICSAYRQNCATDQPVEATSGRLAPLRAAGLTEWILVDMRRNDVDAAQNLPFARIRLRGAATAPAAQSPEAADRNRRPSC